MALADDSATQRTCSITPSVTSLIRLGLTSPDTSLRDALDLARAHARAYMTDLVVEARPTASDSSARFAARTRRSGRAASPVRSPRTLRQSFPRDAVAANAAVVARGVVLGVPQMMRQLALHRRSKTAFVNC